MNLGDFVSWNCAEVEIGHTNKLALCGDRQNINQPEGGSNYEKNFDENLSCFVCSDANSHRNTGHGR